MTEIETIGTPSELTPVQKFYSGKSIFITGATGFFGKILIEKLLYSCSGISTIYVLIRNKKGKNLHTRLDELFDDCVFDRLRNEYPKFRHKVVGVSGDCSLPDLGINTQDRQVLINEVSIVFHGAASVRFDEKLKMATTINVRGTQETLNLFKEMSNKTAFIHVSSAYANVLNKEIDEKFYPTPIDSKKLIMLAESLSDRILDNITPLLLENWPNTYSYTKAVAENIIRTDGQNLPVGVFRPAIVVSTYKEPIKAWINNLYGPTGVCAGAGTGVLRVLHAGPEVSANIVPVDMCVNAMIIATYDVAQRYQKSEETQNNYEIPIYNYESSNDKPINWGTFMKLNEQYGMLCPSAKAIWYYYFYLQKNYYLYLLSILFLHYIPSLLVDTALICVGKSPKMLKIYKKIHKSSSVISYFATRTWHFKSQQMRNLIDSMCNKDKQIFFCDLKHIDWEEFCSVYIRGIRVYLVQDPLDTLPEAITKWNRLYWCHQALKVILLFILIRFLWFFMSFIIKFN